jgi:endonuclease III
MSATKQQSVIKAALQLHWKTFADEQGIKLLFSARISNEIAVAGARALTKSGGTTAKKMAAATWEERTRVLNHSGYARYDEKTSRMLADTSVLLLDRYGGDLRKLREAAERDPREEKRLLMECKGIGEVGASIFLREVQVAWTELQPFADTTALKSAGKLGLPTKADELAKLVSKKDFPRLLAALVRCQLANDHQQVLAAAKER